MDRSFFKRLATQSNKYARTAMIRDNTNLFIGRKWSNITTGEMVRFFGIMLQISMEPRKMGGYATYFQDNVYMDMGGGYKVKLRGFVCQAKEIMPLDRFKQIRSAFHPEAGDNKESGDKCHQL